MAYSLETYVNIRNIPELEKRFSLLEPVVRVYMRDHADIKTALENPEEGRKILADIEAKLEDLRVDMTNIAMAIKFLTGG
jgi:hypothetical protein